MAILTPPDLRLLRTCFFAFTCSFPGRHANLFRPRARWIRYRPMRHGTVDCQAACPASESHHASRPALQVRISWPRRGTAATKPTMVGNYRKERVPIRSPRCSLLIKATCRMLFLEMRLFFHGKEPTSIMRNAILRKSPSGTSSVGVQRPSKPRWRIDWMAGWHLRKAGASPVHPVGCPGRWHRARGRDSASVVLYTPHLSWYSPTPHP